MEISHEDRICLCNRTEFDIQTEHDDSATTGAAETRRAGDRDDVVTGCFPQLYEALAGNPPDQVITL